ncbi:Thiolase [Penicillium hetheringtonii]|uniref:Thiolase n=1 Tax=Penicillium hetheringtonii TaxID=911720 RepID=A0AAD6H062_9EURO|nr:Thiolase [Penicillium hetheringtonii]
MIPIIIGIADIKNRSAKVEDAREPAALMLEAIHAAIKDASGSTANSTKLQSSIDSIDVVKTWTWPYSDLPGLLGQKLGVQPKHKLYSEHGGNQPAKLLDDAARRIATGENQVAVLTGAEALASLAGCVKEGKMPPPGWTSGPEAESITDVFSPTTRELKKDIGGIHSVGAPIHIYPLYENGFRAHRGQSIEENHQESAILYGSFSQTAASNQYAWNYGQKPETAESIGTISKKNRMICFPYPLLMNAFNTVNLGAACIVTSTEFAKQLGVPEEKWIYPLGGAGFRERDLFWERPNFYESSAISKSLDECLKSSSLKPSDIGIYDFYSCFPIVPKLACHHLGISITEPQKAITVLGGLTSFGGAGNNYSMHAITEMVRQLRTGSTQNGLILANGGFLSYQHAICISKQPRRDKTIYPDGSLLQGLISDPIPPIDLEAEGKAQIETYTVEFSRNGSPSCAHIVGRILGSNHRFLANHGDEATLHRLSSRSDEPIGKIGMVIPDPAGEKGQKRNLFYLDNASTARL